MDRVRNGGALRSTGQSSSEQAAAQPPPVLVEIMFHMFNAMNCGGVLLDEAKRVLHSNNRARTNFGHGLAVASERLCASDRGCDAILQTVLDQSLKYRETQTRLRMREAVGSKRSEKPNLIARIVPVSAEAQPELDGAALVLILVDPTDCPEPSHDILEQVFGLTKSEARVASRLMCGESPHTIAEATGVAVGTVRAQMKSVFAKTQTHRQAELVGLLMRVAMISEDRTSI
jgi:DNA-binding CsgD family transcriptional regulator